MPLLTNLITAAISIPINALILWVVLRLFKVKGSYLEALKITAIAGVVMFIVNYALGLALGGAVNLRTDVLGPLWVLLLFILIMFMGSEGGLALLILLIAFIVPVVLYPYLINRFYKQDTKKTLLITANFWMLSFVAAMLIWWALTTIFLLPFFPFP